MFLESGGSHTHGSELAEVGVPHVIAVESQTELPGASQGNLTKKARSAVEMNELH